MATGFTRAKATALLSYAISANTYVALSTTTPNENGGNFTEPAATTGYQRQRFGELNTSITAQIANKNIIFLFEAIADCGSITHAGLCDSQTGNPFLLAELTAPLSVAAGYVPLIRANNFIVGLDKDTLEAY